MGRCAIDHYKEVKRYSVFSHDELICKLASECQYLDPAIGDATKCELDYIVKQEKNSRKSAYDRVGFLGELFSIVYYSLSLLLPDKLYTK